MPHGTFSAHSHTFSSRSAAPQYSAARAAPPAAPASPAKRSTGSSSSPKFHPFSPPTASTPLPHPRGNARARFADSPSHATPRAFPIRPVSEHPSRSLSPSAQSTTAAAGAQPGEAPIFASAWISPVSISANYYHGPFPGTPSPKKRSIFHEAQLCRGR